MENCNLYDNIKIDIVSAHEAINRAGSLYGTLKNVHNFFQKNIAKVLYIFGLYKKFIDSGFYRAWFNEFNDYWVCCLGGRSLYFHDFFFLYGVYRGRFSGVKIEDQGNMRSFEDAWRDPRNIYSTFGSVYKYALSPYQYLHFKKYIKPRARIMEYGCGIAPIVSNMIRDGYAQYDYTIADIQQFTFHYAKWRLKQFGVKIIDINPRELPELPQFYDVIFVMQTFEHLPNPLQVLKHLTAHIVKDGYLFFDFMISDGEGLDTCQALKEREAVLSYIKENYKLVSGKINEKENMGNTVVRKK